LEIGFFDFRAVFFRVTGFRPAISLTFFSPWGPVRAPFLRVNGQMGLRSRAVFAREWAEI
jgi:hypothetical protein